VVEKLIDMAIPEIPEGEKILKEGIIAISMLYQKPDRRYAYKYAITEKGMWTRSPKVPFVKPKTVFMPYDLLESFALSKYDGFPCLIFHPKEGRPESRMFFDDNDGAVKIFDVYIPRTELQTG